MVNLMPMAGMGIRFREAGYNMPKPLILVSGQPMIVQAGLSLPPADKFIFVCLTEHLKCPGLAEVLNENFPGCEIVTVDHVPQGEAATCLLAESHLKQDEPLVIGACDNGMMWDQHRYNSLVMSGDVDAIVWTFRNNCTVKRNPHMYGWLILGPDDYAEKVSCKVPVSSKPERDHAIVGTFYFKKAEYFIKAAKQMIRKGRRVGNEFYVDEAINELIESGLKVKAFEINKYICWGTPNDLRTYEYWESYFRKINSRNFGSGEGAK